MNDVMVDLETLGTTPDAPIIAIGAVFFDRRTSDMGPEFEQAVEFNSACKGRRACPDTIKWWLGQSDAARKAVVRGRATLPGALADLALFIGTRDVQVWGNGATFDISMLEHAYRQYHMPCPWKFWNVRDCRTVEELSPLNRNEFKREGTHHTALADAKFQAQYISAMINSLMP